MYTHSQQVPNRASGSCCTAICKDPRSVLGACRGAADALTPTQRLKSKILLSGPITCQASSTATMTLMLGNTAPEAASNLPVKLKMSLLAGAMASALGRGGGWGGVRGGGGAKKLVPDTIPELFQHGHCLANTHPPPANPVLQGPQGNAKKRQCKSDRTAGPTR